MSRNVLMCACTALLSSMVCLAQEPAKPAAAPAQEAATRRPPPSPEDPNPESASIGIIGWYNPSHFYLRNGEAAVIGDNPATLNYPGKNQPTPGVEISIPAGRFNMLRGSYFRTRGSGGVVLTENIKAFSQDYSTGDAVSAKYTLQNAKVSWEYLTWPYPPTENGLRVKTLWGAQYIAVKSELDAPFYDAANSTSLLALKSSWFIYPSLGIGLEKRFSKSVKWELKAEGFMLPGRAALGDGQMDIAIRGSRIEVLFGGKALYFRTSPKKSEYVKSMMPGGFLEIRWHLK